MDFFSRRRAPAEDGAIEFESRTCSQRHGLIPFDGPIPRTFAMAERVQEILKALALTGGTSFVCIAYSIHDRTLPVRD